jgi:hypothetical protein
MAAVGAATLVRLIPARVASAAEVDQALSILGAALAAAGA